MTVSLYGEVNKMYNTLTPEEEYVLIKKGTERPFTGKYYKMRRPTNKIEDFMPHNIGMSSNTLPYIITNLWNSNLM